MWGWVVHCFKNYAVFKGRASRPEYWWFYLFTFLGSLVTQFVRSPSPSLGLVLIWAWSLLTAVPSWAVASRRLHDTGHSFWWAVSTILLISPMIAIGLINPALAKTHRQLAFLFLGLLFPFFALVIWLLILLSRKGDSGSNRYGDPAPTTPS
jgi:uncharacterized membrane protein YhaH (DUF805 family)